MTEQEELPTAVRAWVKTGVNFEVTGYGHDYLKDRDELVRRQDVEQFLKNRINTYTDENGELRDDLTKVEYGRYLELKKQLQEVQN